ncbi:hypothetical protein F5X96DRAFT_354983 [Biscogniauxia mediterranea]|nr:hypothetical protein F5X96DRAFT_354983 [Biscogniauxia mediterranea]
MRGMGDARANVRPNAVLYLAIPSYDHGHSIPRWGSLFAHRRKYTYIYVCVYMLVRLPRVPGCQGFIGHHTPNGLSGTGWLGTLRTRLQRGRSPSALSVSPGLRYSDISKLQDLVRKGVSEAIGGFRKYGIRLSLYLAAAESLAIDDRDIMQCDSRPETRVRYQHRSTFNKRYLPTNKILRSALLGPPTTPVTERLVAICRPRVICRVSHHARRGLGWVKSMQGPSPPSD